MNQFIISSSTPLAGIADLDFDEMPLEGWLEQDDRAGRTLKPLPPGPWRSLGRHLDYTNWADRERFLELDNAIQRSAQAEE